MSIIYGIDTEKPITPIDVRGAIVECFFQAHKGELKDMSNYGKFSEKEFDKIRRLYIEELIKKYFKEVGGDYNKPTKEIILKVLGKLKEFAVNFRSQEVIKKHAIEIMQLVNKL